jgi:hypothetical protein
MELEAVSVQVLAYTAAPSEAEGIPRPSWKAMFVSLLMQISHLETLLLKMYHNSVLAPVPSLRLPQKVVPSLPLSRLRTIFRIFHHFLQLTPTIKPEQDPMPQVLRPDRTVLLWFRTTLT